MSPKKRVILFFALATILSIAWTVPGEAQWMPYPYPPYPYYGFDPGSAVRVEVTPKEAEVYVDGYYTGIVDDFDGMFQRLRVPPVAHEITIYHAGYRTLRQSVYLTPHATFKIRAAMERLAPGEGSQPRPVAAPQPAPAQQPIPPPQPRGPVGRRIPPPNAPPADNPRGVEASSYGTLAIRVQPAGAGILIDGEPWRGAADQERLVVELPEGTHRVQIQKEGYEGYSTDVQVRRGDTTPLNVSLRTRP